ncbi:MAG: hypothetical protein K1X88_09375 [Nannocystaceae bacterium]|nr:hypothetical protein [Nannocystaceae bacterium]
MSDRHTRWVLAIVAVGLLLRLDVLATGWVMDDLAQRAMLAGTYPVARAPWDLFRFVDGSPAEVAALQASGSLPWWSDPELRLAAMRPLSSALTWFDFRVLGDRAALHHAHSLLWWAALALLLSRLLRRLLPARWALLTLALWVLDECHAQPLAWLANRNAIVAACFAVAALLAQLRAHERGAWSDHAMVCVSWALALAAGEYALCAVGIAIAIAATQPRDRPRARALAGMIVALLGWALCHRAWGYGGAHSAVYVDPLREPWVWTAAALQRVPLLLADLGLAIPTGLVAFSPRAAAVQAAVGVACALALLWLLRARADRLPALRWAVPATLIALVPVVSAFPSARLLLLAAIPGHVIVAGLVLEGLGPAPRSWRRSGPWFAALLLIAHVGLASVWGRRELLDIRHFAAAGDRSALAMPVDDAAAPSQQWIVLAAADPMTLLYPPRVREAHGHPLPAAWTVLSLAPGPHRLQRTGARTATLTVTGGAMLRGKVEQLFRRPDRLPAVGSSVTSGALRLVVEAVDDDGFPLRLGLESAVPLDDPSLVFLLATPQGFVRYPLAREGTSMIVPPASAPQP